MCCVVQIRCVVRGTVRDCVFSVFPGYLAGKGVSGHVLEVSESNLCLQSIVQVRDARFEEVPGLGLL